MHQQFRIEARFQNMSGTSLQNRGLNLALAFGRRKKDDLSFQTMDDCSTSVESTPQQDPESAVPLSPTQRLKSKISSPFRRATSAGKVPSASPKGHGPPLSEEESETTNAGEISNYGKEDDDDRPSMLAAPSKAGGVLDDDGEDTRRDLRTPTTPKKKVKRGTKRPKVKKKRQEKNDSIKTASTVDSSDHFPSPQSSPVPTAADSSTPVSSRPRLLTAPSQLSLIPAKSEFCEGDRMHASQPNLPTFVHPGAGEDQEEKIEKAKRRSKSAKIELKSPQQHRQRGKGCEQSVVSHCARAGGTSRKPACSSKKGHDRRSRHMIELMGSFPSLKKSGAVRKTSSNEMSRSVRAPRRSNSSGGKSRAFYSERAGRSSDEPVAPAPSTLARARSDGYSPSLRDHSVERAMKLLNSSPPSIKSGEKSPKTPRQQHRSNQTPQIRTPSNCFDDDTLKGDIVKSPLGVEAARNGVSRVDLLKQEMREDVQIRRKRHQLKGEKSPRKNNKSSSSSSSGAVDEHLMALAKKRNSKSRKSRDGVSSSSSVASEYTLSSILSKTRGTAGKLAHSSGSVAPHETVPKRSSSLPPSTRRKGVARTKSADVFSINATPRRTTSVGRSVSSADMSAMLRDISWTPHTRKKTLSSRGKDADGASIMTKNNPETPKRNSVRRVHSAVDEPVTPRRKCVVKVHSADTFSSPTPKKSRPRSPSIKRSPRKKDDNSTSIRSAKSPRSQSRSLGSGLDHVDSVSPRSTARVAEGEKEGVDVEYDFDDGDPVAVRPVKGRKVTKTLGSDTDSVVVPQLSLPGIDVSADQKMMVQFEDVASVAISCGADS